MFFHSLTAPKDIILEMQNFTRNSKSIWFISALVSTPSSFQVPRNFCLMRGLSDIGYNVTIITSDSNHLAKPPIFQSASHNEEIEGLKVVWLRTLKYIKTNSMRRILSWIDFEWQLVKFNKKELSSPDVIICSSLSLLTILNGLLLKKKFQCKLIFEVRDIWPLTLVEEGGYSRFHPLILLLAMIEWLGYRYADEVVGTMPNLQEHVSDVLGYERVVHCIPMGYDRFHLENITPVSSDYVDRYIPADKLIVTHLGSVGLTNSLDAFFECAESMASNPLVHFLIVGDGDLRDKYMKQFGSLENISFGPKVEKEMVQSILAKSDITYLAVPRSKVWKYGQSLNKIIDYMLSANPIIASYEGFPSMIDEANCGVIVPPNDPVAIRHAIEEYARIGSVERQKIGSRGRHWIIDNRSYEKLALVYEKLLFQ